MPAAISDQANPVIIHVAHRQDLLPSGGIDAVAAAELQIMLAYGEALAGTGKPLVVSGSIGSPGWENLGRPATEIRCSNRSDAVQVYSAVHTKYKRSNRLGRKGPAAMTLEEVYYVSQGVVEKRLGAS